MRRNYRYTVAAMVRALGVVVSQAVVRTQRHTVRTLSEQEMLDMTQGSSIQASRSSNTGPMIKSVRDANAQGKRCSMISLRDGRDDWHGAVPVAVGGAWEYVRDRATAQKLPTIANASGKAIQAPQSHSGVKFDALVQFEAGGDAADPSGRQWPGHSRRRCLSGRPQRPELQMQLTFVAALPLAPAATAPRWATWC